MKRKNVIPLLAIFAALLLLLSISKGASERLRSAAATLSAPIWQMMAKTRLMFYGSGSDGGEISRTELLQLTLENQRLKKNLENAHQLVQEALSIGKDRQMPQNNLSKHHLDQLKSLQISRWAAVPAEVIYRAPTTWSSSLWIDKGHSANEELGHEIIAKNSPVVVGHALIGVIDYVGERQSRVRLITDSGLTVAVRAARGYPQQQRTAESLDTIIGHIHRAENLDEARKKQIVQQMKALQKLLMQSQGTLYLAKGELHGSSPPLWRSKGQLLKGIGFNYDFADEEGPARDLRSGMPFGINYSSEPVQLLKEHDILMTTGMDGVFPAGLEVAEVVTIGELEEGDYTYELLAAPIAGNLDELSLLFVMPPLGYEPNGA